MAPPRHAVKKIRGFTILTPLHDGDGCIGDDGKIEVAVNDLGDNAHYTAKIFNLVLGSAGTQVFDSEPLLQEGSTSRFSRRLAVGPVSNPTPPGDNRWLVVESDVAGTQQYGFRAAFCGSGSGSSGFRLAVRCQFCGADKPVPVALSLQLDGPVAAGTCAGCDQLNRPTVLVHSGDPGLACCWLSPPIDFCADAANPGFWVLEKADARTWTLLLRRRQAVVVAYRLTTADRACSFPIRLRLAGPGGGECVNWPATVTVSPAP